MRLTCQADCTGFEVLHSLAWQAQQNRASVGSKSRGKDIHFGIELNGETYFKYLLGEVASVAGSTAVRLLERLQLFPADTAGPSVSVQSVGARFSSK